MPKKPERQSAISDQVVDPNVSGILGYQNRKEERQHLPLKKRRQAAKAEAKALERKPGRINLDLPPQIKAALMELAETEGNRIPASQLVSLFIIRGLQQLEAGDLDLRPYKRPTRSPKYDWTLELPGIKNTDVFSATDENKPTRDAPTKTQRRP